MKPNVARPPLVVTGMHRSGTSFVASLLNGLGISMGDRVQPADGHNKAGYAEDSEFRDLQCEMLLAATPANDGGHPDWGWTEQERLDRSVFERFKVRATDLISSRVARGGPWGWKNPRTTVQLEFWDRLLPQPRYLFLYRLPWEVSDSMQRLGADVFLRHPTYGYRIWNYYNRQILDFLHHIGDRGVLVSANAVFEEPERMDTLLRERFGLIVPDGFVRSQIRTPLFRHSALGAALATILQEVRPQTMKLLRDLDAAAALPAQATWVPAAQTASSPAQPQVSVVVPCFNHGEFLIEAVASVEESAGHHPVEIVIVNDGSTEAHTLDVLAGLSRLGYRVLDRENGGLPSARNFGAAATTGRYIVPLDADNRLRPGFISAAIGALDADPAAGVFYSDRFDFGLRNAAVRVPEFDLALLLRGNYIDACAVVRREVWDQVAGWDTNLSNWQDWDLWIGAAERGWRFVHWPEMGFDYRVRPDSMVSACLREEVGVHLQSYIVRKHAATYAKHLPDLLRAAQDAERAAQNAERTVQNAERATRNAERVAEEANRIAEDAQAAHLAVAGQLDLAKETIRDLGRNVVELHTALTMSHQELLDCREKQDALDLSCAAARQETARLYEELDRWRLRVQTIEGTTAWRLRAKVLRLRGWLSPKVKRPG
jgi:Glycosyl transferase family 2